MTDDTEYFEEQIDETPMDVFRSSAEALQSKLEELQSRAKELSGRIERMEQLKKHFANSWNGRIQ
jgi:prefoldin subunit 5